MRAYIANALATIRQGRAPTAAGWRRLEPGPTLSASSHTSRALRRTERRAEWQVSWAFGG